jgi:hypothetical protein
MTCDPTLAQLPLSTQKAGAFLGASCDHAPKYNMESQMFMRSSSIQPLGTIPHE